MLMTANFGPDAVARLRDYMQNHHSETHRMVHHLLALDRRFMLRSDLHDAFEEICDGDETGTLKNGPFATIIEYCQEAALNSVWIYFALRIRTARWIYVRIQTEIMDLTEVPAAEFLHFKERLAAGMPEDSFVVEIDLAPFNRELQKLHEAGSIGRGVEFLNRRLSSRLFEDLGKGDRRLLEFLRMHKYHDQQLMLNGSIRDVTELRRALRQAVALLRAQPAEAGWDAASQGLRGLGFEAGWGDTTTRIRDTMRLLLDILEAPSPSNLERFLGRVPMIFSLAIISPHGYFGQANVLGRPDTGGQVVYILDQVRALEKEMRDRLQAQGLKIEPQIIVLTRLIPEAEGTNCNQRLEPIAGTQYARILRVPFRNEAGEIIPHWISRFEIWPYLERFTVDAEREMLAEMGGRPDLIIGNYSDGNLVASLMSQRMGITQCNIANAMEKTQYLNSDLYWQDNEQQYNFY